MGGPGKAYTPEEKTAMLAAAKTARSRAIYRALMLALNTGERDAEIRGPSGNEWTCARLSAGSGSGRHYSFRGKFSATGGTRQHCNEVFDRRRHVVAMPERKVRGPVQTLWGTVPPRRHGWSAESRWIAILRYRLLRRGRGSSVSCTRIGGRAPSWLDDSIHASRLLRASSFVSP
jgi:hypothetical protein